MKGLIPITKEFVSKHSNTILTGLGVAGIFATAVAGILATPKALDKIKADSKVKHNNEEAYTKKEAIQSALPYYIPTILLGISTAGCVIGANAINSKRYSNVMNALSIVTNGYQEYRNTLIDLHGKEIDDEVCVEMCRKYADFHKLNLNVPDKKVKFRLMATDDYIEVFEREVMDAEYHFNRNYVMRGYASLNELREFLGLEPDANGDEIGWTITSGIPWVEFEHELVRKPDGSEYYVIDTVYAPDEEYLSEWI